MLEVGGIPHTHDDGGHLTALDVAVRQEAPGGIAASQNPQAVKGVNIVGIGMGHGHIGDGAIPNLIGVVCLSGLVLKITKNYTNRKFKNANITPMYSVFPEIQKAQEEAAED